MIQPPCYGRGAYKPGYGNRAPFLLLFMSAQDADKFALNFVILRVDYLHHSAAVFPAESGFSFKKFYAL
jgi:hypothetical protein